MSAETRAAYRERSRERDLVRDFCLLLKLPYRALLHAVDVDHKAYWTCQTSAEENAKVRDLAEKCEHNPELIAHIKARYYAVYPLQQPVFERETRSKVSA